MKEITITSLAEYIASVCELNNALKREHGKRFTTLFRGQPDEKHLLIPSIGRHAGGTISEAILTEERNMIEMAKFKLPDIFGGNMQPIDLLALLQHHGIPTRLLDVSENALVGLYFACCTPGFENSDAEVLVFHHDDNNITNYPVVNAIADSYRMIQGEKTSLESFYEKIVAEPYFKNQVHMYEKHIENSIEGAKWIEECCENLMIIYAQSFHLRQRIQRGRYILFPNKICRDPQGNLVFSKQIDPVPKDHSSIIGRYIVPKEKKEQLRSDLRLLGISKDLLFLDNEDIVCKEIADRVRV